MDRFPLPADASYSYEDGFTGAHRGVDIMAAEGTPVVAVEAGQAWSNIEPKGGKVAYLQSASGTRYFFGHLSSWVLPLISATTARPMVVKAGDEIGKVGTTGNAAGRPPHLHFQIRRAVFRGDPPSNESEPVDPFPELMAADPKRAGIARRKGTTPQDAVSLLLILFAVWVLRKR